MTNTQYNTDPAVAGYLIALACIVVGGLAGAALVWVFAPPVGGAWWPYIHVGAALIGAIVGAKLMILLAWGGAVLLIGILGVLDRVV